MWKEIRCRVTDAFLATYYARKGHKKRGTQQIYRGRIWDRQDGTPLDTSAFIQAAPFSKNFNTYVPNVAEHLVIISGKKPTVIISPQTEDTRKQEVNHP